MRHPFLSASSSVVCPEKIIVMRRELIRAVWKGWLLHQPIDREREREKECAPNCSVGQHATPRGLIERRIPKGAQAKGRHRHGSIHYVICVVAQRCIQAAWQDRRRLIESLPFPSLPIPVPERQRTLLGRWYPYLVTKAPMFQLHHTIGRQWSELVNRDSKKSVTN